MATRPATVQKTMEMQESIFGDYNKQHYSDTDIFERLVECYLKCQESVRKDRWHEVKDRLPQIYGWLLAFCNRHTIPLLEVLWHKYPGVCTRCLLRENCECITKELAYKADDPILFRFRNDRRDMPKSTAAVQEMLYCIFGKINRIKSLLQVYCHLGEEIGEASREKRLGNHKELGGEIADIFAWLCALATRLGVDLDEAYWNSFPGVCDKCYLEKCGCPPPKDRNT